MKRVKKRLISVLLVVMVILQTVCTYATSARAGSVSGFIPEEVINGGQYKEIPVYFEGNEVEVFRKFLRKYNDTAENDNERFDISGIATFRVKAYAYRAGSAIKLGTYIECLGNDGNWFRMNWRDREDQVSSEILKDFLAGKQELSINIDDIVFSVPNENKEELRVIFYMTASTGGRFDRDTERGVEFNTIPESGVEITRTVTEVVGEKNVWDVEIKLEGEGEEITTKSSTDVVLVLDTSQNMKKVNKDTTIGEYVEDSAKKLIDMLIQDSNINVGLVSFGGLKSEEIDVIPAEGMKYYDSNWNPVYIKKEDKIDKDSWASVTTDVALSRDADILKLKVEELMSEGNLTGGSPISLGLVEAAKMLENSDVSNKVIILVTGGEASFKTNGEGNGTYEYNNNPNWKEELKLNTIKAADKAHEVVKGLKIFTINLGTSDDDYAKHILEECATNKTDYVYQVDDTDQPLDVLVGKVGNTVKEDISSTAKLSETLLPNIKIKNENGIISDSVKKVELIDNEAGTTAEVDWSKTSVAITQGIIENVTDRNIEWTIGELKKDVPAILKYRVYMESGVIGQKYNVSENGYVVYRDIDGTTITKEIPNTEIELSWAEINVSTCNNATMEDIPDSETKLWYKVPEDFVPGSMNIGFDTKYDEAKSEVSTTGDKVVKDIIELPNSLNGNKATIIGVLVNESMHSKDTMESTGATITKSPTSVKAMVELPFIDTQITESQNIVQPEGVSNISVQLNFPEKAKDVSYIIDMNNLINDKLGEDYIISYDMDTLKVQIKDMNDDKVLEANSEYIVTKLDGSKIKIDFVNTVNKDDSFAISVYVKSNMNSNIKYGGSDTQTYLSAIKGKIIEIDNSIMARPKIEDVVLEDGTTQEVYSDEDVVMDSKDGEMSKISLVYTEIPYIG